MPTTGSKLHREGEQSRNSQSQHCGASAHDTNASGKQGRTAIPGLAALLRGGSTGAQGMPSLKTPFVGRLLFSSISVVSALTATVSGTTLTFDDQSTSFTTGGTSTVTVDRGSGSLGEQVCQPLHTASACLNFTVSWTDTLTGSTPCADGGFLKRGADASWREEGAR